MTTQVFPRPLGARALLYALVSFVTLATAGPAAAQICPMSVEETGTVQDSTQRGNGRETNNGVRRRPRVRHKSDDVAETQAVSTCGDDWTAPVVSIAPSAGSYTSASLPVTIDWSDETGLDRFAYRFTLNGVDATSQFAVVGGTYNSQATGTVTLSPGQNTLTAEVWDQAGNYNSATAYYTYTYTPPNPAHAPQVARQDDPAQVSAGIVHPGSAVQRDLCVTIATGPGAAYECGDLRLAHALPTTRVLNAARTPVLLYNSQHAHPRPVVPFNVQLNAGSMPTQVRAILWVGEVGAYPVVKADTTWLNGGWQAGLMRFAVGFDGLSYATNAYTYRLQVVSRINGMDQVVDHHGDLSIVNRAASPFGAGWWMAGLEQLVYIPGDGSFLVVGGDGSTRRYSWTNNGVWSTAAVERPDTLWAAGGSFADGFHRKLPNGSAVWYDGSGRHARTVTRLGQTTSFTYNSQGRLATLVLPDPAADTLQARYIFNYDPNNGRLGGICAHRPSTGCRTTELLYGLGDLRVTGIRDPDNTTVGFGYDGAGREVKRRTDRRNHTTSFAYDAVWRLRESSLPVPEAGHTVRHVFSASESAGRSVPVPTANVVTTHDGPRDATDAIDVTTFWVDRWGAPTRVRNAAENDIYLTRSDSRFPALVTRVDYPGGRYVTAGYDALGNLEAQTDWSHARTLQDGSTAYSTTRYARTDPAWPNFVTQVTLPEGEVTRTGYYANGNRAWQQPGTDTARAVRFDYNSLGLVEWINHPATATQGTARERLEYDARGNLQASSTPQGYRTIYHNDAFGRTWKTESPTDGTPGRVMVQENTFYPNSDLVEYSRSIGPDMNSAGQQTVTVRNIYDDEGNPLSVARRSDPDDPNGIGWITTQFRYDPAGRRRAEVAPDGMVDSTYYDPAGNAREVHTRRRNAAGAPLKITMEYDALNRLVKRRVPEAEYRARTHSGTEPLLPAVAIAYGDGMDTLTLPYAYTIRSDSSVFRYHPVHGALEFAGNGDAQTTRAYYPNGALRSETQRIRNVTGDVFSHEYTIAYEYDLNGRTTELVHDPLFTTQTPRNRTSYRYNAATGLPQYVTDLLGNTFEYRFDNAGQLTALIRPGGISESFTYTPDGLIKTNSISNASGSAQRYTAAVLRSTTFNYDWRGKRLSSVNTEGTHDEMTARYSGLGHMVYGRMVSDAMLQVGYRGGYQATDEYVYDALGNVVRSTTASSYAYSLGTGLVGGSTSNTSTVTTSRVHQPGTGRLTKSGNEHRTYDAAGNTDIIYDHQTAYSERVSYYGADGTVRAADVRRAASPVIDTGEKSRIIEEYRYDALGRRVWVRARNWCSDDPGAYVPVCNISKVRRTVWDGSNELYEVQMPGETGSAYLENDTQATDLAVLSGAVRVDPNPFFGTVVYTPGIGVDQPLSLIRMAYADRLDTGGTDRGRRTLSPFALFPLWNTGGMAEAGVFQDGARSNCVRTYTGSGSYDRCVLVAWPIDYYAYARGSVRRAFWHGTVIEDKRDEANTYFRRNRSYDPRVGRFTQEDPIGLAGGLNLYGFANGDPLSYSDPYGLSAEECCLGVAYDGINPRRILENAEWNEQLTGRDRIALGTLGVFSAVGGTGILSAGAASGISLMALRAEYVSKVGALAGVGRAMLDRGVSPEQVARTLHAARRALGVQYKNLTPLPQRLVIYARNWRRYGDRLGPTIEYLRQQGKSWTDIIGSASRSGGADLGL